MKKPAITVRVMPSFLRFGSAQLAAKRPSTSSIADWGLFPEGRKSLAQQAKRAVKDMMTISNRICFWHGQ